MLITMESLTPQSAWDSAGFCEEGICVSNTGIKLLFIEKLLDLNKQTKRLCI